MNKLKTMKSLLTAVAVALMTTTQVYAGSASQVDGPYSSYFTRCLDSLQSNPGYIHVAGWMLANDGTQIDHLLFDSSDGAKSVSLTWRTDVSKSVRTGFSVDLPFTSGSYSGNAITCWAYKGSTPYNVFYITATVDKPTATFDKQGGSNGSDSATVDFNKANPTITVPTKTGYCFAGYYTGTSGTGTKYYNYDGTSAKNWKEVGSKTLYAYWVAPQTVEVSTWSTLKANLNAGNSVKLTANITQTSDKITPTTEVTLDLNGKTLTQAGTWWVFAPRTSTGKVTVKDSATGGKIVGSGSTVSGNGGCVNLQQSGSFVLESGTISGFKATYGGAIYCDSGTFTMNGGTISGCTSTGAKGGGVYNAGTVTMNGGRITGCSVDYSSGQSGCYSYGGGAVFNTGTFTMNGGTIDYNYAYNWANGAAFRSSGTVTINGGTISNNKGDWCGGVVYGGCTFIINGGEFYSNYGAYEVFCDCTLKVAGGYIHGNTTGRKLYKLSSSSYFSGGVFDSENKPTSDNTSGTLSISDGYSFTLIGSSYVLGQSVAQVDSKLTAGTYTFCPTNAEYVAANLAVAPWVDMTKNTSATPNTWTLADNTTATDVGTSAKARMKDGVCWITGSGSTSDEKPLDSQWASVKEVRITDGVEGIGAYFFDRFYNLTNVTVASSCKTLGEGAFYRCFGLEQITFEGEMPETIGDNALVITAGIKMVDGDPVVYAVPNVTVNGESMTLKGKVNLTDAEWQTVTSGEEGNYHFFKFEVGD